MKCFWTILVNAFWFPAASQLKTTFYDFYWKPCEPQNARFVSTVEKTDSGWLRYDYFVATKKLQMKALYEDSECRVKNGWAYYFHPNSRLSSSGNWIHNELNGVYVRYYSNGIPEDSAYYQNGKHVGAHLRWHRSGFLKDSTYQLGDSLYIQMSWFDDGAPAAGGMLWNGKPHGKCVYYHHNGKISAIEIYNKGTVISKTYFNDDGSPQLDTAKANTGPVFKKGGQKGWQNFLVKNLYWPPGYEFVNTGDAMVGVAFTIDEEGKIQDIEVLIPLHDPFDKIAVDAIKNSPPWIPAKSHNRNIKSNFKQSITFQKAE